MKAFLATAVPGYKPLHRTTIRKRLDVLYRQHRSDIRKMLTNVSSLALTTDIWKNSRNRHFICLTAHFYDKNFKTIYITLGFRVVRGRHLAVRLKKFIEYEIDFYGIREKVTSITSDNAPNIVKAIRNLNCGSPHSCVNHNLNLLVKATILPKKKGM